jgi:hypothetical protein
MSYKPKKVSIKDLIHKNEKRFKEKENVKNMFLERCHIRIDSYNNFGREDILFEVPSFVIGLPPYNQWDLLEFLVESLKEDGFYVIHVPKTNSIYISWKKKDIDKIKNKREGFMTLNKNGFFDNLPINPNAIKK